MTATVPEPKESMQVALREVRKDVRQLKAQMKELRHWVRAMTALLISLAAAVVGALVSSSIR